MNSLENLEQLAFDRGNQAFKDWLEQRFPLINVKDLWLEYIKTASDNDFKEWASRDMITNMRKEAKKEIKKDD